MKVIVISHLPLPYEKIGSWSTLYGNYISSKSSQIDILICPPTKERFEGVIYSFFNPTQNLLDSILIKLGKKTKWNSIFKALQVVIQPNEKYIIQVVDNVNILQPLHHFLSERGYRNLFYIQYFYHGFPALIDRSKGDAFFSSIDEIVFLTRASYLHYRDFYNSFPVRASVLHNGVDTQLFTTISKEEKQQLKEQFGVDNKLVFVWCSQDKPKKGLSIILDAWKQLYKKHKNIVLWVIGTSTQSMVVDGVTFFGKIPNKELPRYYQASDVYLFTTLCQEGFGLSLIEAKHCGCYCIASALGGVPEVLDYGKYGVLISNPHFVAEWIGAMEEYIEHPKIMTALPHNLYSAVQWNENMNQLLIQAKQRLS